MESVIERIEQGRFWQFHGGIHPPEMKFLTTDKPIRCLPLPEKLIIPIQQHIGEPGDLLIKVGDSVLKGQPLTKSTAPLVVPVHAPTSGKITDISKQIIAHPSGLHEVCITLIPDGEDTWRERHIVTDISELSVNTLVEKIVDAGISGMGGAGFPTHVKVNTQAQINYLIINAAECEPYITADDLLIREHAASIIDGINILEKILDPAFILIGIEDNKPEAIQALKHETQNLDKIKVCVLPTKYPTGGEKQLIQALTGKEVPTGVLPSSLGIVMQNTATCNAIADAVISDTPLIKRVVTVSGQALAKPQNVWALLGTPVDFLLHHCGYPKQAKKHIIMGGPMMGFSLPSGQVPIVKTTNCILAPSEKEIPDANKEVECIRCGQCAEACPAQLLPQELQWSSKANDYDELDKLNLFDCIECGACAFVCPSHIPLVHYYRVSKAEIRQQKLLDIKAEKAKQRFEARKQRLERDKQAREEKHKKAAEARKARMNSGTKEANNEKSAVAAALARVQAKKAQKSQEVDSISTSEEESSTVTQADNKKSQVAAAIARAKAKKLAAKEQTEEAADTQIDDVKEKSPEEQKKARVAAAVAKAKAKKRASSESPNATADTLGNAESSEVPVPEKDAKKARIAAAVAKAKAKKQANSDNTNTEIDATVNTESNENLASAQDDKKARIAAAVEKAKAKKQAEKLAKEEATIEVKENTLTVESTNNADDKKARIAAAVAKAKAKKQLKDNQQG